MSPESRTNFAAARALVLDGSAHGAEISVQMLKGFGVGRVVRCVTPAEALEGLARETMDLVLVDRDLAGHDGCAFVSRLRRSGLEGNATAPVILTMGHVRTSDLDRARDCGANFVLTKPFSPEVLFKRIVWLSRSQRQFIEAPGYVGPDRRCRFMGPPAGTAGRRIDDRSDPLGAAVSPNLSETEIAGMFKAQRVVI